MPLRLSDRTSNSKALSTICRLLFRRVSFLAFRTRSSSMSMLVLMRRLYTILKHFCASRCDSVSKLAPRVEAAAMLDRRARAAPRPIRMLVRFSQAVFNRGQVQPSDWFSSDAYTRLAPGGAIVLTQTRWHEDDLAGRLLSSSSGEHWDVLSLPAIAEQDESFRRKGEAVSFENGACKLRRIVSLFAPDESFNTSSRMSRFAPRPVIGPPRPTAEYVPPQVVDAFR